jgi:hypothetical protein
VHAIGGQNEEVALRDRQLAIIDLDAEIGAQRPAQERRSGPDEVW